MEVDGFLSFSLLGVAIFQSLDPLDIVPVSCPFAVLPFSVVLVKVVGESLDLVDIDLAAIIGSTQAS